MLPISSAMRSCPRIRFNARRAPEGFAHRRARDTELFAHLLLTDPLTQSQLEEAKPFLA